MDDIASMADDLLVAAFENALEGATGPTPDVLRDEILRRMASRAERIDVRPDGHHV
jgi:hypothetical protein